jgi:hypothetical protein
MDLEETPMKTVRYAYNRDDGIVISKVGSEVAVPVLDYDGIGKDGDFTKAVEYSLERFSVYALGREYPRYVWTRNIPLKLKNKHRAFWGFKPLGKGWRKRR